MPRSEKRNKGLTQYEYRDLQFRKIDLVVKSLIPMLTIVLGIVTFQHQQSTIEMKSYKREQWLSLIELNSQLVESVASLLSEIETHGRVQPDTYKDYKKIYWKTAIFEDSILINQLLDFDQTLSILNDTLIGKHDRQTYNETIEYLDFKGAKLIQECRVSIQEKRNK